MNTPMALAPEDLVAVTDSSVLHIRVTRVYHRHYPEVRGEGRSLREATRQLARLLARSLDAVHGERRSAIEQAIADVKAHSRPQRPEVAWRPGPAPREGAPPERNPVAIAPTRRTCR